MRNWTKRMIAVMLLLAMSVCVNTALAVELGEDTALLKRGRCCGYGTEGGYGGGNRGDYNSNDGYGCYGYGSYGSSGYNSNDGYGCYGYDSYGSGGYRNDFYYNNGGTENESYELYEPRVDQEIVVNPAGSHNAAGLVGLRCQWEYRCGGPRWQFQPYPCCY